MRAALEMRSAGPPRLSQVQRSPGVPAGEAMRKGGPAEGVALAILLVGVFLALCLPFAGFVLDDSFIAYRYAQHLAQGHGLTWNIGHDPVEGYTNLLWVLLNASGIRLGLDPVVLSKLLSVLAAGATILLLVTNTLRHHWSLAVMLAGAIALSPAFALLTMQGMETALTALLVLVLALITLRLSRARPEEPRRGAAGIWAICAGWFAAALLGLLASLDTAVFSAAAFLGLVAVLAVRRDIRSLRPFVITSLPAAGAVAAYLSWRVGYFGYLFPNTYAATMGGASCAAGICGPAYPWSFTVSVLWPYLLLGLLLLWQSPIRKQVLIETVPIVMGCLAFGAYLSAIDPVQGFLWRFAFPAYPAFLLMVSAWARESVAFDLARRWRWLGIGLVAVFAAWALYPLPSALREAADRTPADRIAMGKQLAGLPGRMFVTESGALPFYSDWYAADELGLNSEEIARSGLSLRFLADMQPDLVMVLRRGRYQTPSRRGSSEILNQYMIENGFVALAAVRKTEGRYHFYFARRDSPLFEVLAGRVLGLATVQYGDLADLMRERRIPRYEAR